MPQLLQSLEHNFYSVLNSFMHMADISLDEHSLAQQLRRCHSVEDIITLLQSRAQFFGDIRGTSTINKSIETIVSIFAQLDDSMSLVPQNLFVVYFTSLTNLFSHHPGLRRHYWLVSVRSLTYVPSSSSSVDILLTTD
jgi:hypothetical protein